MIAFETDAMDEVITQQLFDKRETRQPFIYCADGYFLSYLSAKLRLYTNDSYHLSKSLICS